MPSSATTISSSSSTPKRRVSFNKSVKVIKVRHHRQYSDREFQSYWQTLDDYLTIREEVAQTIEYYNNTLSPPCSSSTHLDEEPTFCLRGLEERTNSERKNSKTILRREASRAVFDEQDIQYDLGSPHGSTMIRQVYRIFSLPASRIAQRKGMKDAMEAASLAQKDQPATQATCVAKTSASSKTASSSLETGVQIIMKSIVPHAA